MLRRTIWSLALVLIVTLFLINIITTNAAQIINKEQLLFLGQNLDIGLMGYRYSGPYSVMSGRTIYVEWTADRLVSVYILNEVDWRMWPKYGGPTSYRIMKTAETGNVQFMVHYSDKFYIVVMGFAGSAARLYTWTEKLIWQERIAGKLQIIVRDDHGNRIHYVYISLTGPEQRDGYTNSNGQIIFSDLTPGEYTITLSKSGYQSTTKKVTVQQDITTQAEIILKPSNFSTDPIHIGFNLPLGILLLASTAIVIITTVYAVACEKNKMTARQNKTSDWYGRRS